MISFIRANLFDLRADILVNTVNCVGVMGKGVALEFKRRCPEMFFAYRIACAQKVLRPGTLYEWRRRSEWVFNFPTKLHWRDASKYEYIESGLSTLRAHLMSHGYPYSVAMPALGCGNDGLDWTRVKPMIEKTLGDLPNTIYVCDP